MKSAIDLQWFAAEDEGRTEEPSEYKIKKAREEGRVAKSQELNGTIVLLLCVVMLIFLGSWIEQRMEEMMQFYFKNAMQKNIFDGKFFGAFINFFVGTVLPFLIVGVVAGVIANIVQNRGFLFTTKTITPKFDKLVPRFGEYFKKTLFSFEGVFNIAKSLIKVAVIGLISFFMIRDDLPQLLDMLHTKGIRVALGQLGTMTSRILIVISLFLLGIAIADYVVQRRQFIESLKMTKQEVKEEYKELEGDPEVKSHLDSAQREMLQTNIPRAVKESDVVITNPTHFAVALEWKRDRVDRPQVTAKGEDLTAQNMKRIATENGIPIVENRPVARGLYTDTKVGDIIPETYLKVIATIYSQIGYMEKKGQKV
jgi:flagellar biosynthetic protein FlhB